jgi:hypothetical protein
MLVRVFALGAANLGAGFFSGFPVSSSGMYGDRGCGGQPKPAVPSSQP